MCYAIPGRVKSFDGKFAVIDYFGEEKRAVNELAGLSAGEYVYAQGGFVITRVSAAEAQATLSTWKDLFFELQQIDEKQIKATPWGRTRYTRIRGLMNKVLAKETLAREDQLYLLNVTDPAELEFLFNAANYLRQNEHKNSCCVHGIIEISNFCRRNCHYCGISNLHSGLVRYRMRKEEVMAAVKAAVDDYGFKALVLQSGEDDGFSIDELADLVREIKEKFGVLIFVSFGEVGAEGLEKIYKAGARGLLLRFETSNPLLYEDLHPGYKLETRLADLRKANELGYLIVTGSLIGLPGQTSEDILNDLLLAGELNAEMLSMGPFLPHPATPLADHPAPQEMEVVRALAAGRFILPQSVKILVTTGLETLSPDTRRQGLLAGANSVMLNVTPLKYRSFYEIYPNRAHRNDTIETQISSTLELLKGLGRAPTDLSVRE